MVQLGLHLCEGKVWWPQCRRHWNSQLCVYVDREYDPLFWQELEPLLASFQLLQRLDKQTELELATHIAVPIALQLSESRRPIHTGPLRPCPPRRRNGRRQNHPSHRSLIPVPQRLARHYYCAVQSEVRLARWDLQVAGRADLIRSCSSRIKEQRQYWLCLLVHDYKLQYGVEVGWTNRENALLDNDCWWGSLPQVVVY